MPRAGLADVQHRLATLALTELGEVIRDAVQGKAGRDALAAMMSAVRAYVNAHPGRYAATVGAEFTGPDDPLLAAGTRVINSIAAVLRGYGIAESEMNPAIRTLRSTCTVSPCWRPPAGSSGTPTPTRASSG